ncbi:MAG: transglycosylase SLT domain-containing protein, partial [Rhizobiaceae bacterium]
ALSAHLKSVVLNKTIVILALCLGALPLYAMLPGKGVVDTQQTSAITPPEAVQDALKTGLDALATGDVRQAQSVRDDMTKGSLDQHILQWAIALSGGDAVTSAEIAKAAADLPDWPGLATLRNNSERALYRENPSADAVIAAFGASKPKTPKGAAILARAHVAKGNGAAAREALAPLWRTARMEAVDELIILGEFSSVLTKDDHLTRMQMMLYAERIASAGRVVAVAGAQPLYDAWVSAIRGANTTPALMKAVAPDQQKTAAYQFVEMLSLRKASKFKEAAEALAKVPTDSAALVDADAWWTERRIVARALLDRGQTKLAYQTVAGHAAQSPTSAVEAEFHAGWIALRMLKDPALAATHFQKILTLSSKPQSASRGHYWLGRALEAQGKDAKSAYQSAAHFGTNFYGQLAAARLGMTTLEVPTPSVGNEERTRFDKREAVSAIRRLQALGYSDRARALYCDLAEELDSVGEIALLANQVQARGDHFTALKIGKIAANRGLDVGSLSHPTGAIPASANISGSGQALAYAIARQESEFNTNAISKAGARGLLQLMPATAREIAGRHDMVFEAGRLTGDPGYNATLGAHFLGEQIDRFDGSYILTFAGYNAGPRRSQEWMKKYGDPRGKRIDEVVDWIERIPFSETRNYVQRVMENYQVYKVRLGGSVTIEDDLRFGRRK